MKKFTALFIQKLKPKDKRYYEREENGFVISVEPSGVKRWYFVYNKDGKRYFMTLGFYPDMSLEAARAARDEERKKVKLNKANPKLDKIAEKEKERLDKIAKAEAIEAAKEAEQEAIEAAKEELRKVPTVASLATEYIETYAKTHKRSWKEDERILILDVIPVWGERKAKDITKRDVVLLTRGIIERGSPAMSNATFRLVRKMFNFAVEQDIIPISPVLGAKLQAPVVEKDRALSEEKGEIKALWMILDNNRTP